MVFQSPTEKRSAVGTTDSGGKFELTTFEQGDGAVAGKHQVRVTKVKTADAPKPANPEAEIPRPKEVSLLPVKYGNFQTSGLTAEVTAEGKNEVTLELKD